MSIPLPNSTAGSGILEHLAEITLEHNTILSHMSALLWFLHLWHRRRLHGCPCSGLSLGFGHKVCRYLIKLRVPPWDLQVVLVAFTEKLYESLCPVDMVALASTRRFFLASPSFCGTSLVTKLFILSP